MKLNLYKSVALCSLLALAGCHDFEEMNTNPNAPVYDPSVMDAVRRVLISIIPFRRALWKV